MDKLKMLYNTMMDDMKDGEIYLNNGEKLISTDPELSKYYLELSRYRLSHFLEVHTKFKDIVKKIKNESLTETPNADKMCWNTAHEYFMEKYEHLKYKLETLLKSKM
jgi:hypothetical protein